MEKGQEIYIKAKDSDYLHEIVQKKDWTSLIELASSRNAYIGLILEFFRSDESKAALKDMTEEQILSLIDTAPVEVSNNVLKRMESFCDTDSKFSDIAVKLMKGIYIHGGDLEPSSIVKCLPLNILRIILDSRVPNSEFHFGRSLQEYFMHILSTLSPDSKKNFSYKNLKERDCLNGVYIYINREMGTFPIGRREVFKEVINSLKDCFVFLQTSTAFDKKIEYMRDVLINPYIRLIVRGLQDSVLDYKNDKEIIELLQSVFNEHYTSKYFLSFAQEPILQNNGNRGILESSNVFEDCKVISPNYYYKVFKKAVEENKENFIDKITRAFFTNCMIMHFVRDLNDGIYDKLFNATIDMTVRELIERKQSDNFFRCCNLLSYQQMTTFSNFYSPKLDECFLFIKSVISKIFEKEKTLNVDVTAYPEICCYLLNQLNENNNVLPIPRDPNIDIDYYMRKCSQFSHTALNFLDAEMRNKLVLGVIRHPTDNTKFSHIITSNNPTTLVNFICQLHSVQDIKLILPEAKRYSIDKFGFREGKSAANPKENCKMNLVEIFLQTLRFWENNDKSLFQDGYYSYFQFVKKILRESILSKDVELKKNAIDVYYRFCELVSLVKNAKYINIRIKVASITFLDPLAVIVGSELDKSFVENFVSKYIQPFNAQSYQSILTQVISRSHLSMNYYDDEEEIDNEIDEIFKKIRIDEQMATATRLLLSCIKQNPVKNFNIFYNSGIQEDFFTSENRIKNFIKKKFELMNPKILDVCNPLKTEYPLDISYNNPSLYPVPLREPQYKISHLVFLELCRFIQDEFKEYSPKMFKSNLTKSLIKIQNLVNDISNGGYDIFNYNFSLDMPKIDTQRNFYIDQTRNNFNVLYSKPFFEFLNEVNKNECSIYNDESYEIVKNASIARFLNEEDYLQQKNKPPPKFNGFPIFIIFQSHRYSDNIFNTKSFYENVKNFKLQTYRNTNNLNQDLIKTIERTYNNTKYLDNEPYDDVFKVDTTTHRSHELSESAKTPYYRKNVHTCFITIMDALNKCKADSFANEYDSIEYLQNFTSIKDYGSKSSSYSMLTELFDLLINDFVSTKTNLSKMYKNRIASYNDVYRFMVSVSQLCSPNIGNLSNLQKLCGLNERTIAQKVPNKNIALFDAIFKNGNIEQILLCMNSPLFLLNSNDFYHYLLHQSGLVECKKIINTLINEVSSGKQILDDFLVSLAACSIHPRFVGFPAPQSTLEYLKKITNRSIYAKRAACANAVYYSIMAHLAGEKIPLKEILDIIESAHSKSPDEITAFFCILISENASIRKMSSIPALSDLMIDDALPRHYIIQQGPELNIPKEIGDLYYKCIEKIILSGLKSKKSHIYELTVTVLNEINVGPEIHQIISPFIEKGLKEIEPSDDNEAFLTYATSFTMKNPEFANCFDSYCEALSKIQKHSFAILKANTHLNKDSPYPEPFKKLENSYSTIINTIEKPFIEFKEENEMVSVSQFSRKLLNVLRKKRPAVAQDVFLRLESYASIFGDQLVEDMVHLYKQDKKEEALSKFIIIVTHHEEIVIGLPKSVTQIYQHLKSSFTAKHSVELSRNLDDSQSKLRFSMQRASELADLISPDVLSHMPDEKTIEGLNEDELVEILSNLGIFCKKKEEVITYTTYSVDSFSNSAPPPGAIRFNRVHGPQVKYGAMKMASLGAAAPPPPPEPIMDFAAPMAAPQSFTVTNAMADLADSKVASFASAKRKTRMAPRVLMEAKECAPCEPECAPECEMDAGITCNDECLDVAECECKVDADDDVEAENEIEAENDDGDNETAGGEGNAEEEGGENELNQDQINDAFDLFF